MCSLCGNESQPTREFTSIISIESSPSADSRPSVTIKTGSRLFLCLPCFKSALKSYKSEINGSRVRRPTPGAAGGTTEALRSLKGETISN